MAGSLIVFALPGQGQAEQEMWFVHGRSKAESLFVFADGLIGVALLVEGVAEKQMSIGIIWFNAEGLGIVFDCLIELAIPGLQGAEHADRHVIVRSDLGCMGEESSHV